MCIRNRLFSLLYKLAIVLVSGLGLFLYSGLPGAFTIEPFKYYTIISNAVVFVFYIVASIYMAVRLSKKGPKGVSVFAPHFSGAVLMAILVTFLIYQILLAPRNFVMPGTADAFRNSIVHLIVPLMVLLDYALFSRKGRFTPGDPFLWEIIPLAYFLYAVVAAELGVTYIGGTRYPYYFINVDTYGWGRVLINVFVLCAIFLAIGYVLFGIDKLLSHYAKKPGEREAALDDANTQPAETIGGKQVYRVGDAANMAPADSVLEPASVSAEKPEVIVVEKTTTDENGQ